MPLPVPEPGLVIRYDYLWARERDGGAVEAGKDRPAAIVLVTRAKHGGTLVTVSPITTDQAAPALDGIEIPVAVQRRLGLDGTRPCWVLPTEVNRFVWPGPDIRSIPNGKGRFDYGFLPADLFDELKRRIVKRATDNNKFSAVKRMD